MSTLLINLLPLAIAVIGLGLSWRYKKLWMAAATAAILFVYFQAQPAYLPKGQIMREAPPVFVESDAQIENRLSQPVPGSERDQRMQDAIRQGLDFKK